MFRTSMSSFIYLCRQYRITDRVVSRNIAICLIKSDQITTNHIYQQAYTHDLYGNCNYFAQRCLFNIIAFKIVIN